MNEVTKVFKLPQSLLEPLEFKKVVQDQVIKGELFSILVEGEIGSGKSTTCTEFMKIHC